LSNIYNLSVPNTAPTWPTSITKIADIVDDSFWMLLIWDASNWITDAEWHTLSYSINSITSDPITPITNGGAWNPNDFISINSSNWEIKADLDQVAIIDNDEIVTLTINVTIDDGNGGTLSRNLIVSALHEI
jgi:hypothetical protein